MVAKLEKLPAVDGVETYQSWTERLAPLRARRRRCVGRPGGRSCFSRCSRSSARRCASRSSAGEPRSRCSGSSARPTASSRRPFVIEGSLQGALGATVALALSGAMFLIVRGRIDGELSSLIGVEPTFLPWPFVARNDRPRRRARRCGGFARAAPAGAGLMRRALAVVLTLASVALAARRRRARHRTTGASRNAVDGARARRARPQDRRSRRRGAGIEERALRARRRDQRSPTTAPSFAGGRSTSSRARACSPSAAVSTRFMRHAMDVEHARHALERDVDDERRLRSHAGRRRARSRARRTRSRVARVPTQRHGRGKGCDGRRAAEATSLRERLRRHPRHRTTT